MKISLAVFLLILGVAPAFGQVQELEARAGGVTCGTCFNAALLSLKRLPGVADVTGDAREGWIRVSVDAKKGISIRQAMDRVRVAGLKDDMQCSIKASGTLEKRGGRLVLVVPHQKELFVVDSGDRERMAMNAAAAGERVVATGWMSGSGNQYDVMVTKLQKP